jgi:putative flippase GtrA
MFVAPDMHQSSVRYRGFDSRIARPARALIVLDPPWLTSYRYGNLLSDRSITLHDVLPALAGLSQPSPLRTTIPLQDGRKMARALQRRSMSRGRVLQTFLAYPRSHVWLRFGLVGVMNAGFGYSVFALLVLVGAWPGAALVGTMIAGVAFNFQTSRRLVFGTNGRILQFVAVYTVVLILNWTMLWLLRWRGLPDLTAQALLTLPIAAVSFLSQHRFVFRRATGPV